VHKRIYNTTNDNMHKHHLHAHMAAPVGGAQCCTADTTEKCVYCTNTSELLQWTKCTNFVYVHKGGTTWWSTLSTLLKLALPASIAQLQQTYSSRQTRATNSSSMHEEQHQTLIPKLTIFTNSVKESFEAITYHSYCMQLILPPAPPDCQHPLSHHDYSLRTWLQPQQKTVH
jgi:hypothetical protein